MLIGESFWYGERNFVLEYPTVYINSVSFGRVMQTLVCECARNIWSRNQNIAFRQLHCSSAGCLSAAGYFYKICKLRPASQSCFCFNEIILFMVNVWAALRSANCGRWIHGKMAEVIEHLDWIIRAELLIILQSQAIAKV